MPKGIVRTALWWIETSGDRPITVAEIAEGAGVSVFHLTRSFAAITGIPPARYLRMRRLTQAAHRLARGGEPIVEVALGAGYGSQEAFTRAFTTAFGVTPAAAGRGVPIPPYLLQESITMPETETNPPLMPPRFETTEARQIIGLSARYSFETNGAIPAQWVEFCTRAEAAGLPLTAESFGVCHDMAEDGTFAYLAGVEAKGRALPEGSARITIPAGRYAVFTHRGPAATLRDTVGAIWSSYLPQAEFKTTGKPDFELYPAGYDPTDPEGRVELWVPVEMAECAPAAR
jgi:AraC family transcriptional regulator